MRIFIVFSLNFWNGHAKWTRYFEFCCCKVIVDVFAIEREKYIYEIDVPKVMHRNQQKSSKENML